MRAFNDMERWKVMPHNRRLSEYSSNIPNILRVVTRYSSGSWTFVSIRRLHYPGIRPTNRPFPRRVPSRPPSFSGPAALSPLTAVWRAPAEENSRVHNSRPPINYPTSNCRNNYECARGAIKYIIVHMIQLRVAVYVPRFERGTLNSKTADLLSSCLEVHYRVRNN